MALSVYNGLNLQNQRIVSLADPSSATDAVTKQYVDALVNGLTWKTAVRAATTANVNLTTDIDNGSVLDGVTLATGDRILLKDQSAPAENGIYIVAASGSSSRANDADSTAELHNATVFIREGSVNADDAYTQTATVTTVDTTAQTWVQFGAGGGLTFGDGLIESGGDVDIELTANSGLSLAGGTLGIAAAFAGDALTITAGVLNVIPGTNLEISSDTIRIAATAAGAGLIGGAASALAVGAGTGITLNANDVAVTNPLLDFAANFGDGAATSFNIDHNLNTLDVMVQVFKNSTGETIICDVTRTTVNRVVLAFAVAPTSNEHRVLVLAAG